MSFFLKKEDYNNEVDHGEGYTNKDNCVSQDLHQKFYLCRI